MQHPAIDRGRDQGAPHLVQPGILAAARRERAVGFEQGGLERAGKGSRGRGPARADECLDRQPRGDRTAMVAAHSVGEDRQRRSPPVGQHDRAETKRILLLVAPTDDLARSGLSDPVHARSAGHSADQPQSQVSPHSGTKRSAVLPTLISAWLSSGTGDSSGEPAR